MDAILFPFAEYWWFYAAFNLFVLAMLALDLGVFHREAHEVSFREALGWSVVWVSLALVFNVALWLWLRWRLPDFDPGLIAAAGYRDAAHAAKDISLQFLAGYVVEKSLSVDNIFVFVLCFTYLRVPLKYQHRVLFYGILGALVFRAIFIALGSWLLAIQWIAILFGIFLMVTGLKMMLAPEKGLDPGKNPALRLLRKFLPVTEDYHGQRFLVRIDGRLFATPLLVTLAVVEATDIIFAIDSVPAIFALTREPLIVFTSNVFAILGLRALYFLLAGSVERFHLLKYGLGATLVFVGLKMAWLNEHFGGKFPISWSLGIIGLLIGGSMVGSLLFPKRLGEDGDEGTGPANLP